MLCRQAKTVGADREACTQASNSIFRPENYGEDGGLQMIEWEAGRIATFEID
jgi:hypothetical protein